MHRNQTPVPCRVPWALTDRVMQPIFKQHVERKRPPKMYCFAKEHGFTPAAPGFRCTRNFHIHSLRMKSTHSHAEPHPRRTEPLSLPAYELPHAKLGCHASNVTCERRGADLVCSTSGTGRESHSTVSANFFHRVAYHLFESIYGTLLASYPRIEASDIVVAALYRHALRDIPMERRPPAFAMKQRVQIRGEP